MRTKQKTLQQRQVRYGIGDDGDDDDDQYDGDDGSDGEWVVVVVMVNGCLENSIQENIRLDLFHEPYLPV